MRMVKSMKRYKALEYHKISMYPVNLKINLEHKECYKIYPNCISYKLNDLSDKNEFITCLLNRKSERDYKEYTITLDQISTILNLSYSIHNNSRMVPSAGAKYPLEIYMYTNNSILSQGLYHYNVIDNKIEQLKLGDYTNSFKKYCNDQDFIGKASILIFISVIFDRTMDKYLERGYRYIFLDAGHLGQNIYLACSYLGLSTTAIGGLKEEYLNRLFGLNVNYESIIYAFAIGSAD